MMNPQEKRAAIAALILKVTIASDRRGIKPHFANQMYRGKQQWVVGYSWSKVGANFYSGRVYDAILGWGETFEDALKSANDRNVKP